MKTVVLGLGNPILSDDGVGILVAHEIGKRLPEVEVVEASLASLQLLDYVTGCDRFVLIDSIKTGTGEPGDVCRLEYKAGPVTSHFSAHGIDFFTAVELGRKLGYPIPDQIDIYGIEIQDNTTFCESCTEEVERRIPDIVEEIMKDLIEQSSLDSLGG